LLSSSEHSGVPEDSNPHFFQVLGFTPTLGQSRVATEEGQLFSYSVLHPKPTTRGLVHLRKHPWCKDKPRATHIHLTHHGPDSGEATTFPHILFSRCFVAPASNWLLFPGLLRRSSEIVPVWTPRTLRAHNSRLRPRIGTKFEAIL